jgi:hypothetical protein
MSSKKPSSEPAGSARSRRDVTSSRPMSPTQPRRDNGVAEGDTRSTEAIEQVARCAGLAAAAEVLTAMRAGRLIEPRTWFDQRQAADYLGIAEPTLCLYAKAGCAPNSKKIGRGRRYHRFDLDAWILNGGVDAFPGVDLKIYGANKRRDTDD